MSGLDFESEVEGQSQALAALTATPPAPRSSLAFEPEVGDVLDRVISTEGRASPADHDIASLVELAAGSAPSSERRSTALTQPAGSTDPGIDLSGDLEAELFGSAAKAIPDDIDDFFSTPEMKWQGPPAPAHPEGNRRTTGFLRATRFLPAQAENAFHKLFDSLRSRLWRWDVFLAQFRLNVAGVSAAAAIAALTLVIGVQPQWAAGAAGLCLALVALGQSASSLLGFAGFIIGSAAAAEIIRQRERFQEILQTIIG